MLTSEWIPIISVALWIMFFAGGYMWGYKGGRHMGWSDGYSDGHHCGYILGREVQGWTPSSDELQELDREYVVKRALAKRGIFIDEESYEAVYLDEYKKLYPDLFD